MNPLILTEVVNAGRALIDRIFPDKVKQAEQRANAEREMRQVALDAEDKITAALAASDANQTEVNKIEAASEDKFKSRARPAAIWVCVAGLAYQFVIQPLTAWGSSLAGVPSPPPLDMESLITMLSGLLGLGVYRTVEKLKGRA